MIGQPIVLIVEDNDIIAELAQQTVEDKGWRAIVATTAGEALQILKDGPGIDVLFTDIHLGSAIDGMEVARKAIRFQPNIHVLFTTGRPGLVTPVQSTAIGTRMLPKPYRGAELSKLLTWVLEQPQEEDKGQVAAD